MTIDCLNPDFGRQNANLVAISGGSSLRTITSIRTVGGGWKASLTDDYFKEGEIDLLDRSNFKALMRRELKRSLLCQCADG